MHRNRPTLPWMMLTLVLWMTGHGIASATDRATRVEEVDAYIRSEMAALKIPGLEAVVVHEDQIVYMKGFGIADPSGRPVTVQTPMILGSLSKGFTALAVMQLVEAGKIRLDATVHAYLPWFKLADSPEMDPPDAWKQITIRQLLSHTSGIPNHAGEDSWRSSYAGDDALQRQIVSFAGIALSHYPGESFEYGNANYQILGMIVQEISGQSFEAYIYDRIFAPLDMQHSYVLAATAPELATGYRYFFGNPIASPSIPTPRSNGPSAMIASNAEDMGHYLIAQMNGGAYADVQILSTAGVEQLHRNRVNTGYGFEYAMGWVIDPDGTLSHTGETPSFTSGIHIEGDWGVFFVRNIAANQREQRLDEIAPGILSILRGENPVRNKEDPAFRRILAGLLILTIVQSGGFLWSLKRQKALPHSLRACLVSTALCLALAAALWSAGPVSNHRHIQVLFQSAPDQILLLAINIGLALCCAALQVIRVIRFRSSRARRNVRRRHPAIPIS